MTFKDFLLFFVIRDFFSLNFQYMNWILDFVFIYLILGMYPWKIKTLYYDWKTFSWFPNGGGMLSSWNRIFEPTSVWIYLHSKATMKSLKRIGTIVLIKSDRRPYSKNNLTDWKQTIHLHFPKLETIFSYFNKEKYLKSWLTMDMV